MTSPFSASGHPSRPFGASSSMPQGGSPAHLPVQRIWAVVPCGGSGSRAGGDVPKQYRMLAGLPVLVSAVCGYAHYIAEADSGLVLDEPFEQEQLNQYLQRMLEDNTARAAWARNGLAFADSADLYSMPEHAADVILAQERA